MRSQVPRRPVQRQQVADTPRLQSDERESFFNNLRANTRQQTTTARPFTRPPRRRPQRVEQEPQVENTPRFIEERAFQVLEGFWCKEVEEVEEEKQQLKNLGQ